MCSDRVYPCCFCRLAFDKEEECEFAFDPYNYDLESWLDCLASK